MYVLSWDSVKSATNAVQRGFDFTHAARVFAGFTLEYEDNRRDYGERRISAIGRVDGVDLTVIYTDRVVGAVHERRIISARRSSRRERERYAQSLQDNADPRPRPS